jgi:hypothetical protein
MFYKLLKITSTISTVAIDQDKVARPLRGRVAVALAESIQDYRDFLQVDSHLR